MECRKSVDVVFVIDSTSNLLYRDFYVYVVGSVVDIIRRLDVDSGRTRVAAVQFANDAKVRLRCCLQCKDAQTVFAYKKEAP